MIFDGRWKWELQKQSWSIFIWSRFPTYSDFVKHQLNRAVLYSATILRKVVEDETEFERYVQRRASEQPNSANLNATTVYRWGDENEIEVEKCERPQPPEQKILTVNISATKYPYIEKEDWTIRGKVGPSNYGPGEAAVLSIREVCNWLMHSYVWSITQSSGKRGYAGFLVASDRNKEEFVYFISFDEWQKIIKLVIENGAF